MNCKELINRLRVYVFNQVSTKELSENELYKPKGKLSVCHISAKGNGNAGDDVLAVVLRDLFNQLGGVKRYYKYSVGQCINKWILQRFNSEDLIIIGGGGLFLTDTNSNELSGWQWLCSIENLRKIKKPIVAFAIGYNRFRNQEDFKPVFTQHLNVFVEKSLFVGIRNHGSIEQLKNYLQTEQLRNKLVFQPCMTTLISILYPKLCHWHQKEDCIAFNCAFDRTEKRGISEEIMWSIARVAQKLSSTTRIRYYAHCENDKIILSYFDILQVPYQLVEFRETRKMIEEYSKPRLVIGMRGHSQMIPFGCSTPILSIISHDKLKWFLDDIHHNEWGVEIADKDFEQKLYEKTTKLYDFFQECIKDIECEKEHFWEITKKNIQYIKEKL